MFTIRLTDRLDDAPTRVLPLPSATDDPEIAAFAESVAADSGAGVVHRLPRPLRTPALILLAGTGDGGERGWRAAGAAISRAVPGTEPLAVALPDDLAPEAVQGLAEGLWLGGYRYRDGREESRSAEIHLKIQDFSRYDVSLSRARAAARATILARDLTNTPSSIKNPEWLAEEAVGAAAKWPGVSVSVRAGDDLARFGGLRAVGGGSVSEPRFVELSWNPSGATKHVALVGKGITFDSGGISIKTRPGMKLMRNDMAGAAAVLGATLAAAELQLRVRVSALLPMAENAVSGSAYRPGDVITHYDGTTSESTNSDAEGRLVLADALGYAVAELDPDVIIDMATLTYGQVVALGNRTASIYSGGDDLAAALVAAGSGAGEALWRMPLIDDYHDYLKSDVADRHSSPTQGGGGAALFLREFLGDKRGSWAHIDMAGPAWAEETDLELTKGATGWGARTLLRYLTTLAQPRA